MPTLKKIQNDESHIYHRFLIYYNKLFLVSDQTTLEAEHFLEAQLSLSLQVKRKGNLTSKETENSTNQMKNIHLHWLEENANHHMFITASSIIDLYVDGNRELRYFLLNSV